MSFVFNAVEPKDLEIVVNAMEEKKFNENDVVIQQGDEGAELYVVDSGTLKCFKQFVQFFEKLTKLRLRMKHQNS